jgi:hypothetical protein
MEESFGLNGNSQALGFAISFKQTVITVAMLACRCEQILHMLTVRAFHWLSFDSVY